MYSHLNRINDRRHIKMTGKSVLLKNGMIVDPQAITVPPGDIRIENGRIAELEVTPSWLQ